ncbi:MAG TPA: beta-(1-6) glucans synthase [Xanthobacteraceae bacterium]|nr:beta-(1-6) glucans synthase [Xanthobacteraceae bacterium]
MHRPLLLFAAVAALIAGAWAWLSSTVAMPPSPIGPGEKLYCVSYAPFRGAQSPLEAGTYVTAQQIEQDLARLAQVTGCVRTYSVEHGLDQVPAIAARYGLKVMQGIWLSSHPAKNRWQIDTAVALVTKHRATIAAVIVGNEVLLRGEMAAVQLAATIREVKAAVQLPVTYADVWEFWLRNRSLEAVVDFITIHILPYWEDFPIPAAQAAPHVEAIRGRVVSAFPGKEILIGEVGWPSAGRMREGALPSPVNQARVLHEVLNTAKAGNYRVNVIEAFDQPWKRALEGTVGGHWGLYDDRTRAAKIAWGAPVSNHPRWLTQAAGGIGLAAIVFVAAWNSPRKGRPIPLRRWSSVAAIAAVAGVLFGLTIEKIPIESLGIGGWMRSLALGFVAIAAPMLAAAALTRDMPLPSFARLLGGTDGRPAQALPLALGWVLVVLCAMAIQAALGLVFDPRYKDFPYAPLAAAAIPYVLLVFFGTRAKPEYGVAERVAAAVLLLSAGYIAFNEGFANWQAQSFVALLILLGITLLRFAGVRRRE